VLIWWRKWQRSRKLDSSQTSTNSNRRHVIHGDTIVLLLPELPQGDPERDTRRKADLRDATHRGRSMDGAFILLHRDELAASGVRRTKQRRSRGVGRTVHLEKNDMNDIPALHLELVTANKAPWKAGRSRVWELQGRDGLGEKS
jgi:hypothetical protein